MAPAASGRRPGRHQRVGVEERHGHVADVVGGQLEHLGHGRPDPGHAALAAQAGLGRPRRARGEQQVPERLLGDAGLWPGRGVARPPPRRPACRRGWPGRGRSRRSGSSMIRIRSGGRAGPRSCPSTRVRYPESVTSSWHSVWERSRASSSPRWVGLPPTMTAPARAAPPIQKMNSGTLSSMRATWNGPGRRSEARTAARSAWAATTWSWVQVRSGEGEPHPVVADPLPDQLVDGLHRFPLVVPVGLVCGRQ